MEKEIRDDLSVLKARKNELDFIEFLKANKQERQLAINARRVVREQIEKNEKKRTFKKRLSALLVGGAMIFGVGSVAKDYHDKIDLAKDANGKLIENFMQMEEQQYYSISADELKKLEVFSDSVKAYEEYENQGVMSESDNLNAAKARNEIYVTGNDILPELYLNVIKGEIGKAYDKPIEDVTIKAETEATEIFAKVKGEDGLSDSSKFRNSLDTGLASAIKDIYEIQSSQDPLTVDELVTYYNRMEGLYNRTFKVTSNNNIKQVEEKEK